MNLLTEPLLRVRTDAGVTEMSLPELLNAYGRDDVESLVGIQRFQRDAFHVFTCYLAGAVLARAGLDDPLQSVAFWREALAGLSPAGDQAWELLSDDLASPAFMQPPLPDVGRTVSAPDAEAADALDLLPEKNHDLKRARAYAASPEAWVYALVSLQTMSGFYGRGLYGIARMNGGFGSRLIVELANSLRPGGRWRSAVKRLLVHRAECLAGPWGYDPNGIVLSWQEPWDGERALPLARLDPFFIEVSRRVRIEVGDGRLVAFTWPSKGTRIDAGALNGVVGDPWLPVDLVAQARNGSVKALTVGPSGLDADLLRRLVFQDGLKMSRLQVPEENWRGDAWLLVSVLVRGQGTTDGFHEQAVAIPERVRARLFGASEQRKSLAALAKRAVEYAGTMRRYVLRPALSAALSGGGDAARDAESVWAVTATRRFDRRWSDELFPWLWHQVDNPESEALDEEWLPFLRDHALDCAML